MARIFNARLLVVAFFGSILALFLYFSLNAKEKPTAEKKVRVTAWFSFNGGDMDDPTNYSYIGSSAPNCPGQNNLCAVQADVSNPSAPDNQKQPDITSTLLDEIDEAIQSKQETSHVSLRE